MSRKVQFDFSTFSRRDLALIIGSGLIILVVVIGLIIVIINTGPAATPAETGTPTLMPSLSVSATASLTPTAIETPTPAATATLEPYQYTVQTGETLYYIIQLFGYTDVTVVDEILHLNGLPNADAIYAGQVLLIPRQTPTPGPSATPTVEGLVPTGPTQDYTNCGVENRCISPDGQFWVHIVQPGDTISAIAFAYTSRVDAVRSANGLCEDCPIYPGQQILVPILVTLTPTLTPTGGSNSTATPTPTLSPPSLLAPSNEATIPRGTTPVLQWAAVHPLAAGQYYLVIVTNSGTGEESRFTTRTNAYRLPASLQPGLGQAVRYEWWVGVVSGADAASPLISGMGTVWVFTWGP